MPRSVSKRWLSEVGLPLQAMPAYSTCGLDLVIASRKECVERASFFFEQWADRLFPKISAISLSTRRLTRRASSTDLVRVASGAGAVRERLCPSVSWHPALAHWHPEGAAGLAVAWA